MKSRYHMHYRTLEQQARAYLPSGVKFVDPYAKGFPWHSQGTATEVSQEERRMPATKSTKEKVAAAAENEAAAAAATKTTKSKAAPAPAEPTKTKAPRQPKETAPVSDKELAELIKQKESTTDPKDRAVLRRKIRAALRSRGEFVPVSERPHKEKAPKKEKAAPAATTAPAKATKTKK